MGGKGKGKKKPPSFVEQLVALQGTWRERVPANRKAKDWEIQDSKASTNSTNKGIRKFALFEGDYGELMWGEGQYVLDPRFNSGSTEANWLAGSVDGHIAFTWDRLSSPQSPEGKGKARKGSKGHGKSKDKETSEDEDDGYAGGAEKKAKGKGKTKEKDNWKDREKDKGKGKGKEKDAGKGKDKDSGKGNGKDTGKGKPQPGGKKGGGKGGWVPTVPTSAHHSDGEEKRVDPADGKSYTWDELRAFYAGEFTKKETEAYWAECHRTGKAHVQTSEKRTDPSDGESYTWEEIKDHYADKYKPIQILSYWMTMQVSSKKKSSGGGSSSWK